MATHTVNDDFNHGYTGFIDSNADYIADGGANYSAVGSFPLKVDGTNALLWDGTSGGSGGAGDHIGVQSGDTVASATGHVECNFVWHGDPAAAVDRYCILSYAGGNTDPFGTGPTGGGASAQILNNASSAILTCAVGGGSVTTASSTVPVSALSDGASHTLKIEADATNVIFSLDGSTVATFPNGGGLGYTHSPSMQLFGSGSHDPESAADLTQLYGFTAGPGAGISWTYDIGGGGGGGDTPPPPPDDCITGTRTLETLFAEMVEGECLTLALMLKLTRLDGVVHGFTSLDQDLAWDGITYESNTAISLSTLRSKANTGVDNTDIQGLQTEDAVVEADLRGGRYDNASIILFALNYEDLSQGMMILLQGMIGEVTFARGGFTFEARSLSQRLSQQIGHVYQPLCDALFGDSRCKLNAADFTFSRTVIGTPTRAAISFDGDSHTSGYFTYGLVTFTSGANTGISRPIRSHSLTGGAAAILLQDPFPFNVAAGDTADLLAGDDRTFAVCRDKFHNQVNHRGHPHVPRSDTTIQVARTV